MDAFEKWCADKHGASLSVDLREALREAFNAGEAANRQVGATRYVAPFTMIGGKDEWVTVRFAPHDCIKDSPTKANPSPIRIILLGDLERAQPRATAYNAK